MFGKKKAGKCQLFETFDTEFGSIAEFCRNNTDSGDWIISLGGEVITKRRSSEVAEGEYDDRLLTVYQHQDDSVVLKDVRKLSRKDPEKKGILYDIRFIIVEKIDEFISKLPEKLVKKYCDKFVAMYDKKMKVPYFGNVNQTFVWIPVWEVDAKEAFTVNILNRITLVFT